MAEEKDKSSENIKDLEKIVDTKKKILELHEKEKDLRKEMDKMSEKSLKDEKQHLDHLEEQKKVLGEIIKQKKALQTELKESNKKRKEEEESIVNINDGLKEAIKSQEKLNDLKKKSAIGLKPPPPPPPVKKAIPPTPPPVKKAIPSPPPPVPKPAKEEKPLAKPAVATKPLKPIVQEVDIKTNIDTKSITEELNITEKIKNSTDQINDSINQKSSSLDSVISKKEKELSITQKISDTANASAKKKPIVKEEKPIAKKAEPSKVPKEEKPIAKKAETITQKVNIEADVNTASFVNAQEKITQTFESQSSVTQTIANLTSIIADNNEEQLDTLLDQNKALNDQLKSLQQQQNVSASYKKQQAQKLSTEVKINEEKLKGLGIDEKTIEAYKKTGNKPKPTEPEPVAKAAAPPPPPQPAASPAAPVQPTVTQSAMPGPDVENYEKGLEVAKEMAEAAREIAKFEGYSSENQKQNIALLQKSIQQRESIQAAIEAAREEGKDLDGIEKSISKNIQNRIFAQKRMNELVNSGAVNEAETLSLMKEIEDAMKAQASAERQSALIRREMQATGETDVDKIHEAVKASEQAATLAAAKVEKLKQGIKLEQAEYIALQQSLKQYNKIDESLKNHLKHQKEINARMGIFGNTLRVVGGILDHYGVGKFLKINDAIDAMRAKAEQNGNRFQVMLAGLGSIGKSLVKALTDPVAIITSIVGIFTFLVKKAIEYNAKIFEAGKALGMNVAQAGALRGHFEGIANSNGKLGLTAKELLETQVKMNEQLGFMAPASAEFAQTSTMIMRRFGASAESMAELQLYAVKTGKSLQSSFTTVVGTAKAQAAKLKIQMTEKQILDEISKVSSTVYNNFKGSQTELAKAVVEAKKMGVTLDQVNKIGDSLLDFESSISKEMEAQLLTGKDIDLSKARELALTGDTKGLMSELSKTIMKQGEYEKLNVIQKQAYAEALGMSREEMDKMFHQQKMANLLGEKANASQGQQYEALIAKQMQLGKSKEQAHAAVVQQLGAESAASLQQASIQEKMSAAMERISDIIGRMTQGPLMNLINRVTDWLSNTKNIENVINNVKHYVDEIAKFFNNYVIPAAKQFWEIAKGVYAAFEPVRNILKETVKYLLEHKDVAVGIATAYAALQARKKIINLLGIAGMSSEAKKLPLAKSLTIEEAKKESIIKRQNLALIQQMRLKRQLLTTTTATNRTEKLTLGTKNAQTLAENVQGSAKKKNLATTILTGAKEKINAGLTIVKAIASTVAGSGWMGPLALGVGIAAAGYLYSKLSAAGGGGAAAGGGAGGEGGGIGGGAGAGAAMDKGISPMNQAAETQKTVNNALVAKGKDIDRPTTTNLTVVNNVDPFTGKSLVKVVANDPSTYGDSSKIAATRR